MIRPFPFLLLSVAAVTGCVAPSFPSAWRDLSAPREYVALDEPAVQVASAARQLPIVTSDRMADRRAAMFLADLIEQRCGCRPPVIVEYRGQRCEFADGALYVGGVCANEGWDCPLAAESPEAFRVVVSSGSVRFLGCAEFAVYDWCERALGLRYYGAKSCCFDSGETIESAAMDYSDAPVFAARIATSSAFWLRVAKSGSSHRGGVAVHQPHGWWTNETVRAEHPGIFQDGLTPMLCYGNPETLEYYQRRIDRHLAGEEDSGGIVDSSRRVVTVSQWDAPVNCQCGHCRGKSAAEILWVKFLKPLAAWLKERHPDYLISFLPYLNTCPVPEGMDGLADNTEAELCSMPGLALFKDAATATREEELIRAWRAVTGRKVFSWHYGCWPAERTSAPYVFGRTIRRHYAAMRDETCGSFVCGGFGDLRLELSMFVWMRCLWNPEVDVEAVYDGYARRMFGPAAEPMRALVRLQEDAWEHPWTSPRCTFANVFGVSYPPAVVAQMRELLAEAERCARDDARALARVRRYASGLAEFFAESDANVRATPRTVALGETNELVCARSALSPTPWAKTRVVTSRTENELVFSVTCEEPAMGAVPLARLVEDFAHGNDCVVFSFEQNGVSSTVRVFSTGDVRGGLDGFAASVTASADAWTVTARLALSPCVETAKVIRGNVARWRIADSRAPIEQRVNGSRSEHSRLCTRFTDPDDDPSAYVCFEVEKK